MEKTNNNRAWLVFAACVCASAGGIGMFMNCTGLVFSRIISEFGFRSGDLSIYYSIRFITQAITVGFMSKFVTSKPKVGMSFMAVMGFLNFFLMTFYTQLWQWYISAVLAGIAMCSVFVVTPIFINNWFNKYNGLLIGLSMSASGLAGAVFSPITSSVITKSGWRSAALMLGAGGALLLAVPAILFITTTPEELGLRPFGYTESADKVLSGDHSSQKALPGYIFGIVVITIASAICFSQFTNQTAVFAISIGYTLATGATISSFVQIGNLTGKTVFGLVADKLGIFTTARMMLCVAATSYILFFVGQKSVTLLCIAGLCFGISFSMGTTAPPLLLRTVYGDEAYKKKMSQYQAFNNIITALLASVVPYIYDFTGSFNPVFIMATIMVCVSFAGYTYLSKLNK